MALQRYFFGYATRDMSRTGINTYFDIDLVNRDLMNAFMTQVGERVGRPAYGCKLWDWLMEPLTPVMVTKVQQEVKRIVATDSRLVMQDFALYQLQYGFKISVVLLYQPWNVIATFTADFEARQDMTVETNNSAPLTAESLT